MPDQPYADTTAAVSVAGPGTQHPVAAPPAAAEASTPSEVSESEARRNRLVIGLLLVSAFVVILNETILSVATTHLMDDLGVSAGVVQWLTTGFLLTMAVVIPITGYLLVRFDTRTLFITAMSLFSAGTLIGAVAPGFTVLLVGRIVQASGTAIMFPLLITTVLTLVPEKSRGRVMGNISIVISVAPAIGPMISGLILSVFEWRWMFILVLPVAVAALVLGAVRMKNVTVPRRAPFDLLSVVLSALGFGGLVFGLTSLSEADAAAEGFIRYLPLLVGIVGFALFVLRQLQLQRTDRALLDLRTFRTRTFAVAIMMFTVSMASFFGTIILLPIYLQRVLELDTLGTGLLLLPGGLAMGLLAPVVGRIYDRSGPTALLVAGAVLVSAVLWCMTLLSEGTPVGAVLALHVGLSLGLALLFTPLFTAGLGSLPPSVYSHGSATVATVQQLAGALGTALLVTLMTSRITDLTASGSDTISATAGGVHTAFIAAAIISLFAIPLAFLVRRPADRADGAVHVGH